MKCAILGLNTSNLLPSNSLSPVLTNFMTYPISPLTAILTQFETSVEGRGLPENLHRQIQQMFVKMKRKMTF